MGEYDPTRDVEERIDRLDGDMVACLGEIDDELKAWRSDDDRSPYELVAQRNMIKARLAKRCRKLLCVVAAVAAVAVLANKARRSRR